MNGSIDEPGAPASVHETLTFLAGEFLILDTADLFRIDRTVLKLESGEVEVLPGGGWNLSLLHAGEELEAPWPVAIKAIVESRIHVEYCGT